MNRAMREFLYAVGRGDVTRSERGFVVWRALHATGNRRGEKYLRDATKAGHIADYPPQGRHTFRLSDAGDAARQAGEAA